MRKFFLFALVAASSINIAATAQTTHSASQTQQPTSTVAEPDINEIKDFRVLFQVRESLQSRQQSLGASISELEQRLAFVGDTLPMKNAMADAREDLARARRTNPADTVAVQRFLSANELNLNQIRASIPELRRAEREWDETNRRLFLVEQRLASLFDSTQEVNDFRRTVTIAFAVLVSVVILGFYVIAWRTDGVAKTIFSGEMGMQFVTLFLIVIAIILFGIMGTLEGRELAALLGGLSGYILGRTSSRPAPTDATPQ